MVPAIIMGIIIILLLFIIEKQYHLKNDKVLIFSHKSDIDGMGCVVLLKLVYSNVRSVLCATNEINYKFKTYFEKGILSKYDRIYITDLQLNEENLERINNSNIKEKVILFDHNESVLKFNTYDFVNIVIEDEDRAMLFYFASI